VAVAAGGDGHQARPASGDLQDIISILDADEVQLVAEPEREVLKPGQANVLPQRAIDQALSHLFVMPTRRLPAAFESLRRLMHIDIAH
jgi:hypothetical protein